MKLVDTVPQEIADIIIDFAQDDTNTLKNCALVSNTWTRRCHRHLFHTLTLGGFPWAVQFRRRKLPQPLRDRKPRALQQLKDFNRLLETSPHIPSHCIQNLNLRTDRDPVEPQPRHIHQAISILLSKFTAVRALDLYLEARWANYTVNFRESIHTLIQQPSLSSVSISAATFESISDLSDLVTRSSDLSHLAIQRTRVRCMTPALTPAIPQSIPEPSLIVDHAQLFHLVIRQTTTNRTPSEHTDTSDVNSAPIYLHDLRLGSDHTHDNNLLPGLLHPASPIKLVRLHLLHMDLDYLCGSHRQVMDKLLEQCYPSLQHLGIIENAYSEYGILSIPLRLHSFSDLLSFRFTSYSHSLSAMHDGLKWVVALFSHTVIHSDSTLKEVEIFMISRSRSLWGGAQITVWQELDHALTQTPLHHLRRVSLTIKVLDGLRDVMRNWEVKLIDTLPLLKAHPRIVLEVKFTTDQPYPARFSI